MKTKLWIANLSFTLLCSSIQALGQTHNNMESRYGKTFNAYELRPGIMLRVQKNDQGQITEMRVEGFSGTDSSIHLDKTIDAYLVKEIIDELAPVEGRGNQGQFFGLALIAGGGSNAGYDYENVSIRLLGSVDDKGLHRPNRNRKDNPFQSAEIILIKWKNR